MSTLDRKLPLSSIRTDGGTQPRAALDFDVIDDYAESMQVGAKFPALTIFYDGENYWLADGFHRHKAAWQAEATEIECDIHQGTLEDAKWYSFSANKTNGQRRTNEDKQRAVKAALTHPYADTRSNVDIARHVGVDESTVRDWREKLSSGKPKMATRTVTRKGKTFEMDTSAIGKALAKPVAVEPRPPAETKVKGKRQGILENAAKRRMIAILSEARGLCRGLGELNIPGILNTCAPEEVRTWANIARGSSEKLSTFATSMSRCKGAQEPASTFDLENSITVVMNVVDRALATCSDTERERFLAEIIRTLENMR